MAAETASSGSEQEETGAASHRVHTKASAQGETPRQHPTSATQSRPGTEVKSGAAATAATGATAVAATTAALQPAALAVQPPRAKLRLIKAALQAASTSQRAKESIETASELEHNDASASDKKPPVDAAALLSLAPPSVPLPSASVTSTRRLRVLRDAAVDAIAEEHLRALEQRRREASEVRRAARYRAVHGHEYPGAAPLYPTPAAKGGNEGKEWREAAAAGGAKTPTPASPAAAQPSRKVTTPAAVSSSSSSSSSMSSSSSGSSSSGPFQRTQQRAASRARGRAGAPATPQHYATSTHAAGAQAIPASSSVGAAEAPPRFPEAYLRALPGTLILSSYESFDFTIIRVFHLFPS